ncbi:unnamed protein product [Amoebophrya sp. A120]|nr:unnamed protein product [Amoebophrya sp. A120]|eukprot:GSA120T00001468001.1
MYPIIYDGLSADRIPLQIPHLRSSSTTNSASRRSSSTTSARTSSTASRARSTRSTRATSIADEEDEDVDARTTATSTKTGGDQRNCTSHGDEEDDPVDHNGRLGGENDNEPNTEIARDASASSNKPLPKWRLVDLFPQLPPPQRFLRFVDLEEGEVLTRIDVEKERDLDFSNPWELALMRPGVDAMGQHEKDEEILGGAAITTGGAPGGTTTTSGESAGAQQRPVYNSPRTHSIDSSTQASSAGARETNNYTGGSSVSTGRIKIDDLINADMNHENDRIPPNNTVDDPWGRAPAAHISSKTYSTRNRHAAFLKNNFGTARQVATYMTDLYAHFADILVHEGRVSGDYRNRILIDTFMDSVQSGKPFYNPDDDYFQQEVASGTADLFHDNSCAAVDNKVERAPTNYRDDRQHDVQRPGTSALPAPGATTDHNSELASLYTNRSESGAHLSEIGIDFSSSSLADLQDEKTRRASSTVDESSTSAVIRLAGQQEVVKMVSTSYDKNSRESLNSTNSSNSFSPRVRRSSGTNLERWRPTLAEYMYVANAAIAQLSQNPRQLAGFLGYAASMAPLGIFAETLQAVRHCCGIYEDNLLVPNGVYSLDSMTSTHQGVSLSREEELEELSSLHRQTSGSSFAEYRHTPTRSAQVGAAPMAMGGVGASSPHAARTSTWENGKLVELSTTSTTGHASTSVEHDFYQLQYLQFQKLENEVAQAMSNNSTNFKHDNLPPQIRIPPKEHMFMEQNSVLLEYRGSPAGLDDKQKMKLLSSILNQRAFCAKTPLSLACEKGRPQVVRALLAEPLLDVNCISGFGRTPLMQAAANGHEQVVRLLLQHPELHVARRSDTNTTALYSAAAAGHGVIVEIFLEYFKNLHAVAAKTLNHSTTGRGEVRGTGAAGNHDPQEQLHEVEDPSFSNDFSLSCHSLLSQMSQKFGRSAWLASYTGSVNVISVFLTHLQGIRGHRTSCTRHGAPTAHHPGGPNASADFDVNQRDPSTGQTLLLKAVDAGHYSAAELLLVRGKADADLADKRNRTPLIAAVTMFDKTQRRKFLELLLLKGGAVVVPGDLKLNRGISPKLSTSRKNFGSSSGAGSPKNKSFLERTTPMLLTSRNYEPQTSTSSLLAGGAKNAFLRGRSKSNRQEQYFWYEDESAGRRKKTALLPEEDVETSSAFLQRAVTNPLPTVTPAEGDGQFDTTTTRDHEVVAPGGPSASPPTLGPGVLSAGTAGVTATSNNDARPPQVFRLVKTDDLEEGTVGPAPDLLVANAEHRKDPVRAGMLSPKQRTAGSPRSPAIKTALFIAIEREDVSSARLLEQFMESGWVSSDEDF